MTVNELILIESHKVRRDSSLMVFYVESFFEAFGYKPNCAGCSFSTDWQKLVRFVNGSNKVLITENKNIMSTFKLKKVQNKIFAYRKDGQTFRRYDNHFDEAFANQFLVNGTPEQIDERKKLFSVLPDMFKDGVEVIESTEVDTPTMHNTAKEIKAYAESKGIDVSGLVNKKDLLNAIDKAE